MAKDPKSIREVAAALEDEMEHFHVASGEAQRIPLTSRKNLERAAKATERAAELEGRVLVKVQALVEALTHARHVEEAKSAELHAFAVKVQERGETIAGFLNAFAALGEKARQLNELLHTRPAAVESTEADKSGAEAAGNPDAGQVHAACEALGAIAEDAKALALDAKAKEVEDVAREADSLRQDVLNARNKLKLLLS